MTADDPGQPDVDGYMVVGEVGRTPPHWYPWTIKLLLAITALLAVGAFAAETFYLAYYLAPTARSNADALATLTQRNQVEKDQDACYDLYSAFITDGNANVLAALVAGLAVRAEHDAALDHLVGLVADSPHDFAAIADTVRVVQEVGPRAAKVAERATKASADYDAAVKARADYVAAGRPLPCPNH